MFYNNIKKMRQFEFRARLIKPPIIFGALSYVLSYFNVIHSVLYVPTLLHNYHLQKIFRSVLKHNTYIIFFICDLNVNKLTDNEC